MIAKTSPEQPETYTHTGYGFKVGDRFATSPNGFHTYWDWKVLEVTQEPGGPQKVLCRRCNLDGTDK